MDLQIVRWMVDDCVASSQTARRMLLDGLSSPSSTEEAIDAAIASLLAARDRLGKSIS